MGAIKGIPIPAYGKGEQTRSFCYVEDQIDGLYRLMNGDNIGPINIGNPNEYTILELAQTIQRIVNPANKISFKPLPSDDPKKRQPDISKAKSVLGWQPKVELEEGLTKTISYFKELIAEQKKVE